MATTESLILDGVELNNLTTYRLREVAFPTPRKRYEWVTSSDADGAALVRDPLFEQRTIIATIEVVGASRDAILDAVGVLTAKLEEAEHIQDGIPVIWTPTNATDSLTFYCQSGEIGDIPITFESGYFGGIVQVPLTLTCLPEGFGTEIPGTPVTASTPLVAVTLSNVPGDLPARARIVVADQATKPRRDVRWGLEQRHYNAGTPSTLTLTSLVTIGFSGTSGAASGAYGGNAVTSDTYGQPTAVCGTGDQPHIGTFRVIARVQVGSLPIRIRLAWQDGDGPLSANEWVSAPAADNQWCEIDLGPINITPARLGTQRWSGRVEAYTTDEEIHSLKVNYLMLVPVEEGYGHARAAYAYRPGVTIDHDEFPGFTTGNLDTHVSTSGTAWETSGAGTDFQGEGSAVTRSANDATTGRYGILGGDHVDIDVTARIRQTAAGVNANMGVFARRVDDNNAIRAFINPADSTFTVNVNVAGTGTTYGQKTVALPDLAYFVRLVVFASGGVHAFVLSTGGRIVSRIDIGSGQVAALAPGGALATGRAGIYDRGIAGGVEREYDDVVVAVPPPEPIVVYSGRQIEFRYDGQQRQNAAGTIYGRPPAYRGGPVHVPPAGDENRTTRIVVAARGNDTDLQADGGVTDSTSVQVNVTPCFLVVPH